MTRERIPIHPKGDWFGEIRLPEYKFRIGDCPVVIVGRYMQCQVHTVVPNIVERDEEDAPFCQSLKKEWNASFRRDRLNEAGSPKWVPSGRSGWYGRRLLGPNTAISKEVPELCMLSKHGVVTSNSTVSGTKIRRRPEFPYIAEHDGLRAANNVIYANIVRHVAEVLGVDDFTASYLYLECPALYRGPKVVSDYRELGVSPGLLADLRYRNLEHMLPGLRLAENYSLRGGILDYTQVNYEEHSILRQSKPDDIVRKPAHFRPDKLTDIFAEAIPISRPHRTSRGEDLPGCVARIQESGRVFCETKGHRRHGFLPYGWSQQPGEVVHVMKRALGERVAMGNLSFNSPSEDFVREWMSSPTLWHRIDEIPKYWDVAPSAHLLGYLNRQVPPSLVAKWVPRGVVNEVEMARADFIQREMPDLPIGYITALAMAISRKVYNFKALEAHPELLPGVIDALGKMGAYIDEQQLAEGRLVIEHNGPWDDDRKVTHVPAIENRRWDWRGDSPDVEVEDTVSGLAL